MRLCPYRDFTAISWRMALQNPSVGPNVVPPKFGRSANYQDGAMRLDSAPLAQLPPVGLVPAPAAAPLAAGSTGAPAPVRRRTLPKAKPREPAVVKRLPEEAPDKEGSPKRTKASESNDSDTPVEVEVSDLPSEWGLQDAQDLCTEYGQAQAVKAAIPGAFHVTFCTADAARKAVEALSGLQVPSSKGAVVTIRCKLMNTVTNASTAQAAVTTAISGIAASKSETEAPKPGVSETEAAKTETEAAKTADSRAEPSQEKDQVAPWRRLRRKRKERSEGGNTGSNGVKKEAVNEDDNGGAPAQDTFPKEDLGDLDQKIALRLSELGKWKSDEKTQRKFTKLTTMIMQHVFAEGLSKAVDRVSGIFGVLNSTLGPERAEEFSDWLIEEAADLAETKDLIAALAACASAPEDLAEVAELADVSLGVSSLHQETRWTCVLDVVLADRAIQVGDYSNNAYLVMADRHTIT